MKTPIQTLIVTHLFPEMRAELLRVLSSLTDDEWNVESGCPGWSVRDVAAHILADDIGLLSNHRDKDGQYFKVDSWAELVTLINAQNDLWVKAARRMSRRVLLSFLELTGQQWYEFALTINPHQLGGPIGWKGHEPDPMWIHIARELTEYWMHHQHICQPLGKMSLREARFVHPVLGTFVHAFPQTYRNTATPVDTLVKIIITGEGGGEWHLIREESHWELYADSDLAPAVTVRIDVDSAWRMFTKGITPEQLRRQAAIEGDTALGEIALNTVAIIA